MPDVFAVAHVLVEHTRRHFAADVALIAYYGSYARGTATPSSDLDILYVADGPRAGSLACCFLLDGVPFDFWPVSWRFLEAIADARGGRPWDVAASLLADAKLLWARSEDDEARFAALKAKVRSLTAPERRGVAVARADEAFPAVLRHLGAIRLAVRQGDDPGLRLAAWELVNASLNCLALLNQTYFTKGSGANLPQALALPDRPADLGATIDTITTALEPTVVAEASEKLADQIRGAIREGGRSEAADAARVFDGAYAEIYEHCAKVEAACGRGDARGASAAAVLLQAEVAMMMHEAATGRGPAAADLLGDTREAYDEAGFPDLAGPATEGDLDELAGRAGTLRNRMREWLQERGIATYEFGDVEALRAYLDGRDSGRP